jgi:hypothetical protein
LANAQQRRPYSPEFFGQIAELVSDARSNYDSLQVSATKRYSRGYTLQLAYTLSKTQDHNSIGPNTLQAPQNPADPEAEWALADYHRRHVLRVNGMWELPRMEQRAPVVRHLVGGWRLAGIVSVLSGAPFTVTSGADVALLGPSRALGAQRPNLVADPALDGDRSRQERIAQYFNPAAFARPAAGTFGTAGRNAVIGPGLFTADASMTKQFHWWPSAPGRRIELRVEAFNLFNTVNLGNPIANMSSPAFGRIQTAGDARVIQMGLRFAY